MRGGTPYGFQGRGGEDGSPSWLPEWDAIRKADVSRLVRGAVDPGGVAVVLSSHRNGYVREALIGEIAKRDDPLSTGSVAALGHHGPALYPRARRQQATN